MAFPIAQGLFTDGFAGGCWIGTFGVAGGFFTNGIAFGTGTFFAVLYGATHFTFGFVTFDGTFAAPQFLATGGTAWLFTNGFADLIAHG